MLCASLQGLICALSPVNVTVRSREYVSKARLRTWDGVHVDASVFEVLHLLSTAAKNEGVAAL